jgi:hypothetical protein
MTDTAQPGAPLPGRDSTTGHQASAPAGQNQPGQPITPGPGWTPERIEQDPPPPDGRGEDAAKEALKGATKPGA